MNAIERVKKNLEEHPMIVERMPGILHTLHIPGVTLVNELEEIGFGWKICFFASNNGIVTVLYPINRMSELGNKIFKEELEKPGFYSALTKKWEKYYIEFNKVCKELDSIDLTKLNLEELKEIYLKFIRIFRNAWAIPLIANNISYYIDNVWIPKIIKKYGEKGLEEFLDLATPSTPSFMKQEEKDLLLVAIKDKITQKDLSDLSNKYHWIKNTYRDIIRLDPDYFLKKIKSIKNPELKLEAFENEEKEIKERKKRFKETFSKEELTLVNILILATEQHDKRKKINLVGNYHVFELLKALAEKLPYSFEELGNTTATELEEIFNGREFSNLKSRTKFFVEIFEPGFNKIVGGKEAEEIYNLLNNVDNVDEDIKEFKGTPASLGKAKGKAKVVLDVSKAKDFKEGDILVASMTRPEFTFLMKKASAIITDEGGITCHAAIVSRELGIPCIIGTKIATKVLKDGDLVEVDAEKGVVRIL